MDLNLFETKHPTAGAQHIYDSLLAIEEQKSALLNTLMFFFQPSKIEKWHKKHHEEKLTF